MGQPRPTQRVRRSSDFRRAQRFGRKLTSKHFVVLVHARDDEPDGPARLGLTVSKRVGNAVRRNRTKRLIREAFRHSPELWHTGIDLVVIARPAADSLTSEQVARELTAQEQLLVRRVSQAKKDREIRQSRLAVGS